MKKISFLLPLTVLLLASCSSKKQPEGEKQITGYDEPNRPQYHFSPPEKWMNDPNGMVYFEGEYHLFYQYYPDSTVWGPMHWAHAVSTDMVHWQHLPIALYPDSLGYIFSGSVVADTNNTSGLGSPGKTPLVAIFTHHNMKGEKSGRTDFQYQSIAFSLDKGRTWTKYSGNPVIPNPGIKDFRDPKVFWYEPGKKWVLVLAAYDKVMLYQSADLKNWKQLSVFGIPGDKRLWECPDLFPLKDAATGEEKWVLTVSMQQQGPNGGTATSYFVGTFNGEQFTADIKKQKWMDFGTDNYALVTWANIPATDGRRLALGWMSNWQYAQQVPTEKWRSAMTLPRELTLHKISGDYYIYSSPVKELNSIEDKTVEFKAQEIKDTILLANKPGVHLYKLQFNFQKPDTGTIEFKISNLANEYITVGYHAADRQYYINRERSGKTGFSKDFPKNITAGTYYSDSTVMFELYLDRSSAELFADGGKLSLTTIHFPATPYSKIELSASNNVRLISGKVTELHSIWKK